MDKRNDIFDISVQSGIKETSNELREVNCQLSVPDIIFAHKNLSQSAISFSLCFTYSLALLQGNYKGLYYRKSDARSN